ncbi:MAG: DUF1697 domain-containing protein [Pseudonocardiaceae bacterium]
MLVHLSELAMYVALFRGINVGRAKRVAMADLRALFTDLGYDGVRTVLQSGNVVFHTAGPLAADAAARIESALPARTARAVYQWCPQGVLASRVPASF